MTGYTVQVENPDTLLRAFRSHLPGDLAQQVYPTLAIQTAVFVAVTQRGWTPRELAKECAAALDHTRPGAVITHRLRQAANGTTPRPTNHPALATFRQPSPWCGQCSDPVCRWVLGDPPAQRCSCWTPPPKGARP